MIASRVRFLCVSLVSAWLLFAASLASAEDPGPSIVQKLQARYDDTRPECDGGLAAFYCDGVIVRAIRDFSEPKFWNPSPSGIARNGVSASYIRKDVGSDRTPGPAGFIMNELEEPGFYPVEMRCVFPSNANTGQRADSCATEDFPLSCDESGVTDIPTWQAHYLEYEGRKSCYFKPTAQWFQFNVEVRAHFPDPTHRWYWNEVVFAAWPQDIPEQLPIEAFFFTRDGLHEDGREEARLLQDRFIQATGKFVPLVRIALDQPGDVFFYAPRDQSQRYLEGVKVAVQ